MVCTALELLPHWSVAVQVRVITLVLPQFGVTESLEVITTEPHPSVAVATPVAFVDVFAGHSSTRLAGALTFGGVVSRIVIV